MENQNWQSYAKHYKKLSIAELSEIASNTELYHDDARWAALMLIEQQGQELTEAQKELIVKFKIAATEKEIVKQIAEPPKKVVILELFSPRAILGLSIFFSVICGGLLMSWNLRKVGKSRQAVYVLLVAFLLVFGAGVLFTFYGVNQWVSLGINTLGALFFIEYYWKNYLGENLVYKRKPLAKVIFIAMLVSFAIPVILISLFPESLEALG